MERPALQMHVTPSTVAAGPRAMDQPHALKQVKVVGQKVRLDTDQSAKLDRGAIRANQLVHDAQSHWITQCRVAGGAPLNRWIIHRATIVTQSNLSQ